MTCTHPAGLYDFLDCGAAEQVCVPDWAARCAPGQWVCDGTDVALFSADRMRRNDCRLHTDAGWVCYQGRCIDPATKPPPPARISLRVLVAI
jgi:hypothetical protein